MNSSSGVVGFTINQTTGVLSLIAGSPFPAASGTFGVVADPASKFLYVENNGTNEIPLFIFAIDPTTGALTQAGSQGLTGAQAGFASFTTSTAAVKYTPTLGYATNSGSNSITELSIANGGLGFITGSPITDANGPQTSVATPNGAFVYSGNGNGSISEYKVGKTGTLSKITGSPITGFTNVTALAVDPLLPLLYVIDPTSSGVLHTFHINPKTGVLTTGSGTIIAGSPRSIAIDLNGIVYVTLSSNQLDFGVDGFGFQGTVATGTSPVSVTVDPTDRFVYVANNGDGTVSAFAIQNSGFGLTEIAGSPFVAGSAPTAVIAEPYGKYLYVANSGSNTISAYSIDPLTGALTPISGTFSTQSGPSH